MTKVLKYMNPLLGAEGIEVDLPETNCRRLLVRNRLVTNSYLHVTI